MKKIIISLFLLPFSLGTLCAQQIPAVAKVFGLKVTYDNGVEMTICGQKMALSNMGKSQSFIDFKAMKSYNMVVLPTGDTLTVESPLVFADLQKVGTDTILNWPVTQVRTSINSNTIDIWYTPDLGFYGTPMVGYGQPKGLVLKVARNGRGSEATSIERLTKPVDIFPASWGRFVDAAEQRYEMMQSVVTNIKVFNDDRLGFVGGAAPEKIDKEMELYTVAGGTVVLKKVKLPENIDEKSIFVELSQYSDGDAYDRTGSVFVIPADKKHSFLDALSAKGLKSLPAFESDTNKYHGLISTSTYDVPVELMRFFTPFGVRKFNHIKVKGQVWADSVIYRQEVTHLAPLLKGEAWVGAYIGNWDGKGHKVSLTLKYHPEGDAKPSAQVIPLFNTVNLMEQAGQGYPTFFDKDSLRVTFKLKKEIKNAQLVYISTGHGGWGGGDEFNQKLNTLYLDGKKVFVYIPWRGDCATYRSLNPCSGNFSNGLSSSDLSRSNWCPGSVTSPTYIPLGDLAKGEHTMAVQIPLGKPEGSSFSYWCISGVIIGE